MAKLSRFGFSILAFLFAISPVFSQFDVEDDLRRADKQFDLYAYNLALQSYQSAFEKAPNNSHAMTRMADCLFQLNRPADALTWYDRATNTDDSKPDVLLNYGKALMATGNYPAAKKWFLFYAQHNQKVGQHFSEMCEYALENLGKEALYTATDEPMNSTASDFGAAFLNGKVVFNSARTDLAKRSKGGTTNDWAGTAYNQLLLTQADPKGFLQKPAFLKGDLANNFNEGPVSFSPDGRRVAFCKNNFVDGTRQIANSGLNMNLFIADVQSNGEWSNQKAFSYNSSEYSNGYPCWTADGKTLFFASNQPGGEGGWDLYFSNWTGKSWSKPQNLGDKINTAGNEITPFLAGNNLFFSSDWQLGFGGMDVFRAELVEGSWEKIFHLGPGINSPRDDYGFIFDSEDNVGYLTSNRSGGKGNEDIWKITKRTDDFEIVVLDGSKKPIEGATIDFAECGGKDFLTNAAGKYSFSVSYGKADCGATVKKAGFRPGEIDIKSDGSKLITLILEPDGFGKFIGQVLDYQTKTPLTDVEVRALPMPKGAVVEATTGKDGSYNLNLEAKKTYKISFSKEGFADSMISLETGNVKATNDVSAIYLQNQISNMTAGTEKSPAPLEFSTKSEPTKKEPVVEKEKTAATEKLKTEPAKTVEKPAEKTAKKAADNPVMSELKTAPSKTVNGFAVQIASFPGNVSAEKLSRYDKMRPFGNIYTRSGGKASKVRVGVFSTREEALAVQKKAVSLNFKGAFVMAEKNIEQSLVFSAPKTEAKTETKPVPASISTVTPAAKPAQAEANLPKKPVRFAIQLASLANDQTVNLATYMKITDLGNVYTRSENDMTKIRLGVWENADDAKKSQEAVAKRGFKDAVVVIETSTASTEKFLVKTQPAKTTAVTSPKGITKPVESSTKLAPPVSNYKVRVATFIGKEDFDDASVNGVKGSIERKKEGKKTIILLSGYSDFASATQAKNLVQTVGYRDAFVVIDEKGKLKKATE